VVEVRLFGELEAADGGVALAVRGVKQRALLALLALYQGEPLAEFASAGFAAIERAHLDEPRRRPRPATYGTG
jgi:hypothetical protein